jgi:hypothetical protein
MGWWESGGVVGWIKSGATGAGGGLVGWKREGRSSVGRSGGCKRCLAKGWDFHKVLRGVKVEGVGEEGIDWGSTEGVFSWDDGLVGWGCTWTEKSLSVRVLGLVKGFRRF